MTPPTFKKMLVLRKTMSLEPFLNLTVFAFLPVHFPEEDPRHRTQEEGQEEAAVHQTIFQPSITPLCSHWKNCHSPGGNNVSYKTQTAQTPQHMVGSIIRLFVVVLSIDY